MLQARWDSSGFSSRGDLSFQSSSVWSASRERRDLILEHDWRQRKREFKTEALWAEKLHVITSVLLQRQQPSSQHTHFQMETVCSIEKASVTDGNKGVDGIFKRIIFHLLCSWTLQIYFHWPKHSQVHSTNNVVLSLAPCSGLSIFVRACISCQSIKVERRSSWTA